MNPVRLILKAVGILALGSLAACAGPGPVLTGNDTGGIITWNPEHQAYRHAMAAEHCARYRKTHRITSVHPWYGDYIGFECRWDRRERLHDREVVIRSRG
jgi:hypothetical protein